MRMVDARCYESLSFAKAKMTPYTAMTPNLPASTPAITSAQPPELPSETLFKGHKELHIRHAGEQYRSRITRSGKLILTK